MNVEIKKLPKSQVELTITVSPLEQGPHLARAAEKISHEAKIPGFRPGKAPYDVVVSQVGEMKVMEAALEPIVRTTFVEAIKTHALHTVGTPEVTFEKTAPHNDIVYRATVSLLPTVSLPDFSKISVSVTEPTVASTEIDAVLADLQKMHAIAVAAPEGAAAGAHDQVTVDLDLLDGLVPLEGGQARGHVVHLDEPYYVSGFTEKIMGAHVGDALEFSLPFPKEHYQKIYAGKTITFKVKVLKIETRELPPIDEAFATRMGVASVDALRAQIEKNLLDDHQHRAQEAAEIDMLKQVVAAATFEEIPDVMIESERHKMLQELASSLQRHGISPDQYFADMKKSPQEVLAGFTEQATERVKMGLVTFAVGREQNISVTPEELQTELAAIAEGYKDNKDATKRLQSAEVQDMVLSSMRNRKVVEWMKGVMIKEL